MYIFNWFWFLSFQWNFGLSVHDSYCLPVKIFREQLVCKKQNSIIILIWKTSNQNFLQISKFLSDFLNSSKFPTTKGPIFLENNELKFALLYAFLHIAYWIPTAFYEILHICYNVKRIALKNY